MKDHVRQGRWGASGGACCIPWFLVVWHTIDAGLAGVGRRGLHGEHWGRHGHAGRLRLFHGRGAACVTMSGKTVGDHLSQWGQLESWLRESHPDARQRPAAWLKRL